MWERRAFLKAAGAGFLATLVPQRAAALANAELVFATATRVAPGRYGAALVTDGGRLVANVELPARGHDVTYSAAAGRAVVFARRPGTFALVFDPDGQVAPVTLTSPAGRHFFGHGVFAPDGRLLYASENDFEQGGGVIGIYDVAGGYARIGEFPTYGVGPHEMLLMPDGETFAVANGGIATHPDYGRAELNIETMAPSLAFVDRRDGHLVGRLALEAGLHKLSIRHMTVDAQNRVWFGCQFRGDQIERPQVVGYATMDGDIRLIELPPDALDGLRNYVGALAASADGETIAISSPPGNCLLAVDARSGRTLALETLRSGSGIAPDRGGFVATNGFGEMVGFAGAAVPERQFDFLFDNHIRRLVERCS